MLEVRGLADSLLDGQTDVVETCVRFVCAETVNLWHGRGRAMMCRRLKHIPLARNQKERLVVCICHRLSTGQFSEQFRDQLRLSLRLDPRTTLAAATRALKSDRPHVERYAKWVLAHPVFGNGAKQVAAGSSRESADQSSL